MRPNKHIVITPTRAMGMEMEMEMDDEEAAATFEHLYPSRFLSLSFPNPLPSASNHHPNPYADSLRVAVLDSPNPTPKPHATTAAMLVPRGRESDWIFSTVDGHLQLLLAASSPRPLSRLILVGDPPSDDSDSPPIVYARPNSEEEHRLRGLPTQQFEQSLLPLLLALSPRSAFEGGLPQIPFLSYVDDVVRSLVVDIASGPVAGEMLVEDVEIIETSTEAAHTSTPPLLLPPAEVGREFRRRLRFKRMPNLVQTQIRLVRDASDDDDSGGFRLETGVLVQPYLVPMVAGLLLASPLLEQRTRLDSPRPRVLCVGVGGGALLTFLESQLEFDVLGLESDEVVLSVARRHFGLTEGEFLRVRVGDGLDFLESFTLEVGIRRDSRGGLCPCRELGWWQDRVDSGVDVIMVDLDSGDARSGVMAPPWEFVRKSVLSGARLALHQQQGILVINAIPSNGCLYDGLVGTLREVFSGLYEIDVGNDENCVLIATASPVGLLANVNQGPLFQKLKQIVGERYADGMRKL